MASTSDDRLTDEFERQRSRLRSVAYNLLGSLSDADDALQTAWLRMARADLDEVENLPGWMTTVVARVSLNLLRSQRRRRESPLEVHVPDPIVEPAEGTDPEREALVAEALSLALLVVLDQLAPEERLAFVMHDAFGVPFDEIASMLGKSSVATRQLASRARRRAHGSAPPPDVDPVHQREVVDAFFAAAREGDVEALVAVLDPDVVLRSDAGPDRPRDTVEVRGAREVAGRALMFSGLSPHVRPARINGVAGVLVASARRRFSIMAFTVRGGRVVAIDSLADPQRLRALPIT